MLPFLSAAAPLITGGASLLGSMFSANTSAQNTQSQIAAQMGMQGETERFNMQEAQKQRDWQTGMFQQQVGLANTAYERASADMQKAGLNPAMMFGSGSAAGTPSAGGGAAASVGTPSVPMPQRSSGWAGIGDAVKAGMASAVQAKEMDLLTSRTAQLDLENKEKDRQLSAGKPETEVGYTRALTGAAEASRGLSDAHRQELNQLLAIRAPEADFGRFYNSLSDAERGGRNYEKFYADIVKTGAGAVGSVIDLLPAKARQAWQSAAKSPEAFTPSERRLMQKSQGYDLMDKYEQLRGRSVGPGSNANY